MTRHAVSRRDVLLQRADIAMYVAKGDHTGAEIYETEQDRRAAILYRRYGPGQWPVCGR